MAKEFKRTAGPASKGKRPSAIKGKSKPTRTSPSFAKNRRDSEDEGAEDTRRNFKDKTPVDSKKPRFDKSKEKSSFERYRDGAKPSDFGTSTRRTGSSFAGKRSEERPFRKGGDAEDKRPSFRKDKEEKGSFGEERAFKRGAGRSEEKPAFKRGAGRSEEKPAFKRRVGEPVSFDKKRTGASRTVSKKEKTVNPYDMDESDLEYGKETPTKSKGLAYVKKPYGKKAVSSKKRGDSKPQRESDDGMIRLNKYISNAGICSRREADELIESGVVQVNGKVITEMGYRVKPTDIVKYGGQTLKKEKMVYLVLNKPKDYITTVDDPQKRRTVLELVQGACKERIYPVGRLDRSTTGLLMFTNDGELTKKMTHPRYGVRKIYHIELDKPLKKQDLDQIAEGIELEDGEIKVDEISYVGDGKDKTQVGVEIHSGKNRIVRRIFEHLGYNVRKLDRVMFSSLTKKDLAKGRWRFLTEAEVGMLKMIGTD